MTNKLEQFYKTILHKKFAKRHDAGYDPKEVDEFLDQVLLFFNEINGDFLSLIEKNDNQLEISKKLKAKLEKSKSENAFLQARIDEILKDGYQNHQIKKDIDELKKKMNENDKG